MNPAEPVSSEVRSGHLYVVATPIGNLGDLSPRALDILRNVDRIAAEDTRTSGRLLAQFGVDRPLVAMHEHNEDRMAQTLVEQIQKGSSLAIISDAGTPLISDPGFAVVRAARGAGVPVIAIPGPCAAIAALSVAGLPSDAFVFAGFLPHKRGARRERLTALAAEPRTVILYESSHRIAEALDDIVEVIGADRPLCLARELTKRFEESHTAPAGALRSWLAQDSNRSRGEFVLVLGGAPAAAAGQHEADRLLKLLLQELPPSRAAKLAAELGAGSRQDLFRRALELGGEAKD